MTQASQGVTVTAMYTCQQVKTKADLKKFIDLPWDIYRGDVNWVPPLKLAVKDLLDTKKHPFYKHSEMVMFLGYKNQTCIARVAGVIDHSFNEFHDEKTAYFGFFEAQNDQKIVNLLMDEVRDWAKKRGMTSILGPMNPSTNYECGLLVDGFNESPMVMMTYNPPYYESLLKEWGFEKEKDLLAYRLVNRKFDDRIYKVAERMKKKNSITCRPVDLSNFESEVKLILEIYNDAWEKNWGFVPMDREEFYHSAKDMKQIMDPRLCVIVEVGGVPAGFILSLPDINQVFKKIKNGKLFPTGLLKLLWHTKGPGRKKITRCRIPIGGVKKAYQPLGLGPLLYTEITNRLLAAGYIDGEASWILEDNALMRGSLEMVGGGQSKVYRMFRRATL